MPRTSQAARKLNSGRSHRRAPRRPRTSRTHTGGRRDRSSVSVRHKSKPTRRKSLAARRKDVGRKRSMKGGGSTVKSQQSSLPLDVLNTIKWKVTDLPERAVWRGKSAAENRNILERVLIKGEIRLLLPVVKESSEDKGKHLVAYAVPVKGREVLSNEIRFGDVLHKIHAFYTGTKVSKEDVEYAAMGDASLPLGATLRETRFADFIGDQTTFAGLTSQGSGTYALALKA